jgi:protein-S-isoprenylcysteine O-methyltransferase Ste14
MTPIHPNESSGQRWVTIQYFLMIGVLLAGPWGAERWGGTWNGWVGIPLFLLGAWAGLRGKADLGRQRTTRPEPLPDNQLVTGGIYSMLRHPLYASLILLGFGWAVLWNSVPALGLALVQAVFLDAKARCEERHLRNRHPGYDAYSRRVKRFVPGLY